MLDNAYKLSNNLLRVILLRMPREIQLSIFEQDVLSVADRVCLTLTCKTFARALSSDPKLLTFPEKIKHGEEEHVREIYLECCPVEDSFNDEDLDDWVAKRKKIDYEARNRVNQDELDGLFKRLDKGWNRSSARFCGSCNKFVSTEQNYWDEKDRQFSYRSNSEIAQKWRTGPCNCGEYFEHGTYARGYVQLWIQGAPAAVKCPCCEVQKWGCCHDCERYCCCC